MSIGLGKQAPGVKRRREKHRRMNNNEFGIEAAAYPDGRVAVLLSRYPDLSKADFDEVLEFVDKARPVQLRRLRSSDLTRTKLDRFLKEQRTRLTNPPELVSWTTFAIFVALLMCWLLWEGRSRPLSQRSPDTQISAPSSFAMTPHRKAGGDP